MGAMAVHLSAVIMEAAAVLEEGMRISPGMITMGRVMAAAAGVTMAVRGAMIRITAPVTAIHLKARELMVRMISVSERATRIMV